MLTRFAARFVGLALAFACPLAAQERPLPPFPVPTGERPDEAPARSIPAATAFVLPCRDYRRGLHDGGNFGVLITRKDSPFRGSRHLAEDCWLPGGTEVRAVAAGIVRYADFSPTFEDAQGIVHWNLGHVVVIEHRLDPPLDGLDALCSVYVHLGRGLRVAVDDLVEAGRPIGRIGADRSEENGRYPAHLHFGLHRGPYLQVPPSWRAVLEAQAMGDGVPTGFGTNLRGKLGFRMVGEDSVFVHGEDSSDGILFSLLMGSTAPADRCPADIALWCSGYGDHAALDEWLAPSRFLDQRMRDTRK